MAKILFWSHNYANDKADACTFYRCIEPARVLSGRGHDVTVTHEVGLATAMQADVLVIARPTEVGPRAIMSKLLALPESARPRIVAELDDDLFSIPESNPAHPWMEVPARRERLRVAIEQADRVTVTNEHLAHRVMDETGRGRVCLVPNYVPERFVVAGVPELGRIGAARQSPTLVWAGSDTHRGDFGEMAIALRQLLRERTDFRVRVVGAPYAARLWTSVTGPDLPPNRIEQLPWIEGVPRYIEALAGHIGLAPLENTLFNRSKSDLRLKELAARGMAVAASTAGPYALSEVPRAWVGETPEQRWHQTLTWLLDTPEHREHVASEGLKWAQENTLEAHAAQWEKALLD